MNMMFLLLGLIWITIMALGFLAIRANQVERSEGLEVSRGRPITLAGVVVVSTLLVGLIALTPAPDKAIDPEILTRSAPLKALSGDDQMQAAQLQEHLNSVVQRLQQIHDQEKPFEQKQQALLQDQLETRAKLDQLGGHSRIFGSMLNPFRNTDSRGRADVGLILLLVLLVVGIAGLVLGGKLQALFPDGLVMAGVGSLKDEEIRRRLDEVASLTLAEKYREARDLAATISEKKLKPFDFLDLLYLRALCKIQIVLFPLDSDASDTRTETLLSAIADLEFVLEQAPKREDALYALGIAYGYNTQFALSLDAFDRAEPLLHDKLKAELDANRGICCLRLAEESLRQGDTQQAEIFFERAARLGQQSESVLQSRIRIAMLDLSASLGRKDMAASTAALARIEALPNLPAEQKAQIQVIAMALEARLALRRDDPEKAFQTCNTFLTTYLPSDLPRPNDSFADGTYSPVLEADLPFPAAIFQSFLFLRAVALSKLKGNLNVSPASAEIDNLAGSLLLGLMLVPRQRDLLGALGGLYSWFRRERADAARGWLEAAILMGARGRLIRAILEHDRMLDQQRGSALDWFRSASARFLRDPALSGEVRHALLGELGRFQEFAPMLMSLEERPQFAEEEPTLEALRSRAAYLAQLVANVANGTGSIDRLTRLSQLHAEFNACLQALEASSQTIAALERKAFSELADTLAMR